MAHRLRLGTEYQRELCARQLIALLASQLTVFDSIKVDFVIGPMCAEVLSGNSRKDATASPTVLIVASLCQNMVMNMQIHLTALKQQTAGLRVRRSSLEPWQNGVRYL